MLVSDKRHLVMDPHLAVIPREEPILERERLAGFIDPGKLSQDSFSVFHMEPINPQVVSG
jgi:hypothetical protein